MYCNLVDNIGITVPPADFIAAVEPVAVETRNPLERECITGVSNSSPPSLVTLHQRVNNQYLIYSNNIFGPHLRSLYYDIAPETAAGDSSWIWMCNQNVVQSGCFHPDPIDESWNSRELYWFRTSMKNIVKYLIWYHEETQSGMSTQFKRVSPYPRLHSIDSNHTTLQSWGSAEITRSKLLAVAAQRCPVLRLASKRWRFCSTCRSQKGKRLNRLQSHNFIHKWQRSSKHE